MRTQFSGPLSRFNPRSNEVGYRCIETSRGLHFTNPYFENIWQILGPVFLMAVWGFMNYGLAKYILFNRSLDNT
jgi:hypothetical protein